MTFFDRPNIFCLRFLPHRESLSAVLFYISTWSSLFILTINLTTLEYTDKVLNKNIYSFLVCFVCLAALNILFLTDYSRKEMLLIISISLVFYYSTLCGGNKMILISFILALAGRHVNWTRFIRFSSIYYLGLLGFVYLLYRNDFITTMNFTRTGSDIIRVDWGFAHPNTLASYVLMFCMLWILGRLDKIRTYDFIILAAAAIFCYVFPDTRTCTAVIALMIILLPVFHKWKNAVISGRIWRIIIYAVYPLCFIFSLSMSQTFDYNSKIHMELDSLLSGRLHMAQDFLNKYNVPLWGQYIRTRSSARVVFHGGETAILDNSYVRILISNGLIPTLVYIMIMIYIIYNMFRYKQLHMLLIIFLMALLCLSENRLTMLEFNPVYYALPLISQLKANVRPHGRRVQKVYR